MSIPAPIFVRTVRRATSSGAAAELWPEFEWISVLESRGPSHYVRHRHTDHELIVVQAGRYECLVNDQRLRLSRGDALLIKPGDTHEDFCTGRTRYVVVRFHLIARRGSSAVSMLASNTSPADQVLRDLLPRVRHILSRILEQSPGEDVFAPMMQDALLCELFWLAGNALPRHVLSSAVLNRARDVGLVSALDAVFERHLRAIPSLSVLASEMGMGVRALHLNCRRILGRTPHQALMLHKVRRARELLLTTDLPIKAVSEQVGFANRYHFSRVFTRLAGITPAAIRNG